MTQLEKMMVKLELIKEAIQKALDNDDTETAKAEMANANALKERIEIQKKLDADINQELTDEAKSLPSLASESTKENASAIRAIIKKMTRCPMTDSEKALLLPSAADPNGKNGEAYILPQDIRTKINKRIRQFKSFRDVIGMIETTAMTGSLPVEDLSGIQGLADLTDGAPITASEDPKFTNVSWSLRKKGAIITMSNTLLEMTDNALEAYVIDYFAKKAVITENLMAIAALKKDKSVKTLTTCLALKSAIIKVLDPASLYNTRIVTNQDGFDKFSQETDLNGRPMLQPDPTQPDKFIMFGYPVDMFSNSMLASSEATEEADGYAPIFVGNLEEGAKFVMHKDIRFASSSEAGFTSDTTLSKVIELIDCIQYDGSDECYFCGQIKVADKITAQDDDPNEDDPNESNP